MHRPECEATLRQVDVEQRQPVLQRLQSESAQN